MEGYKYFYGMYTFLFGFFLNRTNKAEDIHWSDDCKSIIDNKRKIVITTESEVNDEHKGKLAPLELTRKYTDLALEIMRDKSIKVTQVNHEIMRLHELFLDELLAIC